MKFSLIEENLMKTFEEFEIVDAHEHLPPEKIRLDHEVDVFTLFSQYTKHDLSSSGMPKECLDAIYNSAIPIEKRWKMFAPYLKYIRYSSFTRPAFIAAKEFYGFDDINEGNYKALSKQIAAENTPGIYRRILREKCKIQVALTQVEVKMEYKLDLLLPLLPLDTYAGITSKRFVEERSLELCEKVKTLDDYLELIRKGLKKWKSEGVVGLKMRPFPYSKTKRSKAIALFNALMKNASNKLPESVTPLGNITPRLFPERNEKDLKLMKSPLYSFLLDEILDMMAELDLVAAVHTGMWGDFRVIAPQNMIPILSLHPNTRFDIFHLGIPYVRETAILGKSFSNVWINLCWCHVISPNITRLVINELIDLVPINKVIAFGGDYTIPVEKVYGSLVMARENMAKVLGQRIKDELLTEDEAVEIAKRWFCDNPKELYQLHS